MEIYEIHKSIRDKYSNLRARLITPARRHLLFYRQIYSDAFIVGLSLLAVAFFVTLFVNEGAAQAIGNVIGSALGAFGAFLVAKWTQDKSDAPRKEKGLNLAFTLFEAFDDRRELLGRLSSSAKQWTSGNPDDLAQGFVTIVNNYRQRDIDASFRFVFSDQFSYAFQKALSVDGLVRNACTSVSNWQILKSNGIANQTELNGQMSAALRHLRQAAHAWRAIIRECDQTAQEVNKPGSFRSALKAADEYAIVFSDAKKKIP